MTKPSLISRLLSINGDKIVRHAGYLYIRLCCRMAKLFARSYPDYIDNVSTHMTVQEKHVLFRLARRLPAGSSLAEIGSYHGASSCCLAAGIASRNSTLFCVDTWRNDAVTDALSDVFPVWQKNTEPFETLIKSVQGYSHEVADRIPNELDLLFIDGDHSYEGVKRDLEMYLPKLRKGGVLVMHDWSHESVHRAVQEYVFPVESSKLVQLCNLYSCRI